MCEDRLSVPMTGFFIQSFVNDQSLKFNSGETIVVATCESVGRAEVDFVEVISSSMLQLLPFENHLCGIAKAGYYPEIVQHTHWNYGKNGKGYYNHIFAPGWTVASL